jgi:PAS domain S-box-containing protein
MSTIDRMGRAWGACRRSKATLPSRNCCTDGPRDRESLREGRNGDRGRHEHGAKYAGTSFAEDLIDESPDALLALSLEGRILAWNRGAEAIFGYTVEEAIGKPIDELVVPENRRAEARQALEAVVEKGTFLFETVRRRKDGSLIHIDITKRLVEATSDRPTFIAVSKKDVTQLKRLQVQQALEAPFRDLLDAAPDAMVIVDENGRIRLVNEQVEKLFGYRREELLGQAIEVLVPERFHGGHPAHRSGYLRDPRSAVAAHGNESRSLGAPQGWYRVSCRNQPRTHVDRGGHARHRGDSRRERTPEDGGEVPGIP